MPSSSLPRKIVQYCPECGLETVFEVAVGEQEQVERCLSCGSIIRTDYAKLRDILSRRVSRLGP